jgi:addiction module HigA family antidote
MVLHPEKLEGAALNFFVRLLAESWIKLTGFGRSMNLLCLQVIDWSVCKATGRINTVFALTDNTEFALPGRKVMPTRSKSQITTDVGRRLPRNRPPTHPGEMLLEEFIKPLGLTQAELARLLDVSYPRLNEIIKGRRSVTPDTALRLSRVLGMSADFWLGLQQDWDLWNAMNSPEGKLISRLKPFSKNQHSFA